MTEQVSWGDGSGDVIYLVFNASEGNQTVSVSSDANTGAARSKVVTFATGSITRSLTINQEAGGPVEHTVKLIPSSYGVSNSTYVSVSDASNMYHDTSNTTYATITATRTATTTYYLYLRGFNIGDIPSNAAVTSFTLRIKARISGQSTSSSQAPRIVNGSQVIANTTASENFGTSTSSIKTITVPTGALTWTNIKNYGSNFGIQCYVKRSNKNNTAYLYLYGAELEVTYTL